MPNSTLLLADDSVTIQKVVNLTFSGEGIDVVNVSDGNSAMDVLREGQADLVMADVNLPGINGYEICESIRAMDTGREIPVILLVGSFEPFDADEAQRVGATAHLTKPFESIASLVEMVHGYLGSAAPQERFEETVEYPTDADMVVSESSIPYVGGFEDETIEAESYGGEPEAAEPAFGQAEEPSAEGSAYEEFTPEPVESEGDYVEYSAPEQVEEQESYAEYSAPEPVPAEEEYAGYSSSEPVEAEGEHRYGGETPEPAYGYDAPEPEPAADREPEEEGRVEETVERTYLYGEPILTSMDEGGPIPPYEAPFVRDYPAPEPEPEQEHEPEQEAQYEPEPEYEPRRYDAAATVQLDESDLLELPIDPAFAEVEDEPAAEEPVGDRFEETIREEFIAVEEERVSGVEISDELIDEIARRVVAKLSDRAVREIAWEVVPEMAEMIIRKMTEQKLNE